MPDIIQQESLQKILELQQAFKASLPEKISDIESLWVQIQKENAPDFVEMHLKMHSLVGTSGTFGADLLCLEARKIEQIIKSFIRDDFILDVDCIDKINGYLTKLNEIANNWEPFSVPIIPDNREEDESEWKSNVYLVEDDVEIVTPIIKVLEQSGYRVFYYRKITEFEKEYGENDRASAIIMDMAFKEGNIAGAETIKRLEDEFDHFPPVIFISAHAEIDARLAAAQVGAKKYLTKPLNLNNLLFSVNELTGHKKLKPYRVLLIDDEIDILEYYSTVLRNDKIDVLSMSSPTEAYAAIEEFKPELIVLDLYMKECSGFDFAKVVRQNDEYAYIPIVFLSAELDTSTQLAAMDLGGDDFLIKPVNAEYFRQAILSRVKRARSMEYLHTNLASTLLDNKYQLITLDKHAFVSMADINGKIIYVNERFVALSGYDRDELMGVNHRLLKSGKHSDAFYKEMWETISKGNVWNGQICNKSRDGNEYWLETTIVPFLNEKGKPYKYVAVRTDISEIKKAKEDAVLAEIEIIKAKEEAENANRAKSAFLSRMSHELRTPMNAICGFAQLLKLDAEDRFTPQQANNVEEIIEASNHLLNLINEILELSKIESGKLRITIEEVSFSSIVVATIKLLKPLLEEKSISLNIEMKGKPLSIASLNNDDTKIKVDQFRFREVILNLLSNAIKYNYENGKIIIKLDTSGDNYFRISVSDTGKGIDDESLAELFTEFNRLTEENSAIEGTGIGLMIAKNTTELMDGKIGVESEIGKGSMFWVEFPLA